MVGHVLSRFERTAVMQEDRNSRARERVVAEFRGQARRRAPGFHDAQHVAAGNSFSREPLRLVECLEYTDDVNIPELDVAGSIPVSRSMFSIIWEEPSDSGI
jgi:hypothetical protein